MFTDFVLNGQAHGDVATRMSMIHFDEGLARPYIDQSGQHCVTVNTGRTEFKDGKIVPVFEKKLVAEYVQNGQMAPTNNALTLRKDEWLMMDQAVLQATRQRLRAWIDLAAAASFGGFNGMSKMVLEHETITDAGEAIVDMDGLSEGNSDIPQTQLEGLPLPITHSSFMFGSRQLSVSRNTGTPLDTTMAEQAGRRIAEKIEKTLIGTNTGIGYGDGTGIYGENSGSKPTVFGYTTHPDRITKTDITTPTGVTTSEDTVSDVLEMRQLAYDQSFYGPFMLYHSSDWDTFLDNDYGVGTPGATAAFAPNQTLRMRLRQIEGIQDVRRLDFFTSTFELVLVQMTSDVVRAVNGMDITTLQWETKGGMQLNFKVMAIMVPQIRSQFIRQDQTVAGRKCGIVHGTTS